MTLLSNIVREFGDQEGAFTALRGPSNGECLNLRGVELDNISNVILENVDLSGSKSVTNKHGIRMDFTNVFCFFRYVNFSKCGVLGTFGGTYDECQFTGCSAKESAFIGLFINCVFEKVNFTKAHIRGNFINCRFDQCNLKLNSVGGGYKHCVFNDNKIPAWIQNGYPGLYKDASDCTYSVTGDRLRINEYIKFHNSPEWPDTRPNNAIQKRSR